MKRDTIRLLAFAGMLLATRVLCGVGPPSARLAATWGTLLVAPALLLSVPFGRGRGTLDALAVGAGAAIGIFSIAALVVHLAGGGLSVLLAIYPACVVGAGAARLVVEERRGHAPGGIAPSRQPGRMTVLLAAGAGTLLLLVATLRERPVDFRMDVYDHVGAASRMAARDRIFSREMGDGDEGPCIDPRKGTWNTMLAAAKRLSDADGLVLWRTATFIANLVALLAIARVAHEFLGAAWPLGALLLLFAQEGGPGGAWLSRSAYPGTLALFLYAMFLAEALAVARGRRGAPFLLAAGLALVHLLAGVFAIAAALLLLPLGLRERVTPRERRRFAAAIGAIVAVVGGIGAWRVAAAGPLANPIQTEVQGVLFLTKDLFVPEPRTFSERLGAEGLLGLLAAPLLIEKARRDLGLAWILLLTALLVLLASPPLATILGRRIGYLLRRLPALSPLPLLIGFLAVELARAPSAARRGILAVASRAGLAALLVLPGIRVGQAAALAVEGPRVPPPPAREAHWTPELLRIAERIPENARVATDPVTGYVLYARTSARPFVLPDQHGAPNDAENGARLTQIARILSPWTPAAERRAILEAGEASHILVNDGLGEEIRTFGLPVSPENLALLGETLAAPGSGYALAAAEGPLRLYEISHGVATGAEGAVSANPFLAGAALGREGLPTEAGIRVGSPVLSEARVRPGELLSVRCVLARPAGELPIGDYSAYLAIARDAASSSAWAKVTRAVRGLAAQPRDRVLFHRDLASGRYPVLLWGAEEAIADTFWIRVPRDIAPGTYRVTMNIVRTAYFPNRTLRALLTDRDEYEGIPVGTVVVSEHEEGV